MKHFTLFVFLLAVLGLSACATPATEPVVVPEPGMSEPVSPPVDMGMPVLPQVDKPISTEMVVIELASYQDPKSGLAFDYPATWVLDEVVLGSRAPFGIQLTSWTHEPGMISEVPEEGTSLNILAQQWDPKGDLLAFSENRKIAWENSGFIILSENSLSLANGQPAVEYFVQSPDISAYHLFSTLGGDYLVVSGSGNLESITQIAHSIRLP